MDVNECKYFSGLKAKSFTRLLRALKSGVKLFAPAQNFSSLLMMKYEFFKFSRHKNLLLVFMDLFLLPPPPTSIKTSSHDLLFLGV